MIQPITQLIARILLAQIFLISGISKIFGYANTQAYMESTGVPGILLPLVILLEIGGALALVLGWQTRWAALALAAFTALAAIFFHTDFSDRIQTIMFMKNWAMTGGLLLLAAQGAGELSLDNRLSRSEHSP